MADERTQLVFYEAPIEQASAETEPPLAGNNGIADAVVDLERTIVIRDRRKPNQYTTDNVIAREWLPILRVGDAFFFYSVYLSMANRETESSWGSLRTQAEYLQCGVDLIIRGNRLLEICELLYIEPGDHMTSNEYYILDPPPLTPDDIAATETSKNWKAWVAQVRQALDRHHSLTSIWAERRARRGGRPVKTVRPQKGEREPQSGFPSPDSEQPTAGTENAGCGSHAPSLCATTSVHVSHAQGTCDTQPEQEQETENSKLLEPSLVASLSSDETALRSLCCCLGVAQGVVDVLLDKYPLHQLWQQLEWLPARNPRDPAAMWISSVQGNWARPAQVYREQARHVWTAWMAGSGQLSQDAHAVEGGECAAAIGVDERLDGQNVPVVIVPGTNLDAQITWAHVLEELRMQMTRATFDMWLQGSVVQDVQDGLLSIRVRDAYAAEWLRSSVTLLTFDSWPAATRVLSR
jgi:hypothetical protein